MKGFMPDVPSVVRAKAEAVGASGWLKTLPGLLTDIEGDWSLRVGAPFGDATEAYVAEVALEDGTPAVLKLLVPRDGDEARHEITVLERCAGEGCAALLRSDVSRGALLLERLGPSLHDLGLPVGQRHEILCDTASRVWRPADSLDLTTGARKAELLAGWVTEWWEELGRPCTRRAIDHALACAERRRAAYDPTRAVMVHGDVHEWNALSSGEGFKLVDPDGLLAEPEYDLGIIMREDPLELMEGDPRERATFLAERTGLDGAGLDRAPRHQGGNAAGRHPDAARRRDSGGMTDVSVALFGVMTARRRHSHRRAVSP
jgi:streptomycin 6-kinase